MMVVGCESGVPVCTCVRQGASPAPCLTLVTTAAAEVAAAAAEVAAAAAHVKKQLWGHTDSTSTAR